MTIRPRRSVLYMPGSNARAIEKAKSLPVDGIIIDLEDAVAPDAKEAARTQVADAVRAGGFGHREVMIRLNGIDAPSFAHDFDAATAARPDAILVPKISTPTQIEMIGTRLLDTRADHHVRLWAMIETPTALFNIRALSTSPAVGENAALHGSIWLGWIRVLPSKPNSRASAHSRAKPCVSPMSLKTPSTMSSP